MHRLFLSVLFTVAEFTPYLRGFIFLQSEIKISNYCDIVQIIV